MKSCLSIPVALFFLLLVTGPASANVTNDQVQSQHIREADGTSDQNTNSGAGVKTGHIQDSAVTGAKIADGAVTSAKLATPMYTKGEVDALIGNLQSQIGALQYLLQNFSRNGNEITIAGANLNVMNGSGTTLETGNNSLGNLVIGYNENPDGGLGPEDREGSHNLVIGIGHKYTSAGGLVAGRNNVIAARFTAVTGGLNNTANAEGASVSGGSNNMAQGGEASVCGGDHNNAVGASSTIAGGSYNNAYHYYATVVGGSSNWGNANYSTVCGGYSNAAAHEWATVMGGNSNFAGGQYSTVAGGAGNQALGKFSSVSGGQGNRVEGISSSISGGYMRQTSSAGTFDWVAGDLWQDQ